MRVTRDEEMEEIGRVTRYINNRSPILTLRNGHDQGRPSAFTKRSEKKERPPVATDVKRMQRDRVKDM